MLLMDRFNHVFLVLKGDTITSRKNRSDESLLKSKVLASFLNIYSLSPPLYFFLSVLLYGLVATLQFDLIHKSFSDLINSYIGSGPGGDPIQFMWFLSWWPYALTHGLDPFQTHYIWSLSGVNLLWVTSEEPVKMILGRQMFGEKFLCLMLRGS
jgi:hypothetical protein